MADEVMDLSAVMAPEPTVSDVDTDVDVDTGNDFDTDSDVDVDTDIDSDMELDSNTESDIDGKPVKPNKIDLTKTEFKKLPENIKKIFNLNPLNSYVIGQIKNDSFKTFKSIKIHV